MPAGKKDKAVAGYSGTPLPKKLGLKEEFRIVLHRAPRGFRQALGPLPAGARVTTVRDGVLDLVLLFTREKADLEKEFSRWTGRLAPAGMIWVAWPKKSSGVATDLSFDAVQKAGLKAGLVDTKICAIDETWSGLRFVRRLKDR